MSGQYVAVPLLEGVHSSTEALEIWHVTTIDGIACHVRLPQWNHGFGPLRPPRDEHNEQHHDWPELKWGYTNTTALGSSVTIRALGLIPIDATVPPGDELLAFELAVGRWKHLLRDWLSVIAEGPTDYLAPTWGETLWGSPDHDHYLLYAKERAGEIRWPQPVSRWEWEHALEHVRSGDRPPLARILLTTATRAGAAGDWRLAVIDAATAAEVALTSGLTARLSAEASPQVVQARIKRTRMLGPRLKLARNLGMTLPATIDADLLKPRNAVVHGGTKVTASDARAAIAAACQVVDEYEPRAAHCQEPFDRGWEPLPVE